MEPCGALLPGDDVSRCLCPILGDYAMACASQGHRIQWRYNVKECEPTCSLGQEYTVCADSCLRTCADVAVNGAGVCKPVCVEGCACPTGQVLDDKNQCVPVGMCPCYHKGVKFDAGYKECRSGVKERELCTCVGARWECVPATDNDIQNYPPAEDLKTNCSAANHMEFTTCEIAEPLTCKNMHLPPSTTTAECRPGCQCKKGYVLETVSKKCVLASECPCHHGGRSYPDGHVMQEECNKCECKKGNWSCTTKKCAGVCTAWGDSHVITFDGSEYDFEGVCSYLLAKGVLDGNDGFDVEIQKCAGVCTAWGDSHVITFDGSEYDFEGVCSYLLAKGVLDGNDGFDVEIQKCAGVCTAWGDSHVITFDGSEYDFEGVCSYLLAKGVLDGNDGFDVEIQAEFASPAHERMPRELVWTHLFIDGSEYDLEGVCSYLLAKGVLDGNDGFDVEIQGVCSYLLAKGVLDGNDGFDVEIQNVACGSTGATCSKSVTLKVGNGQNEEIVLLNKDAPLPDISTMKRIKLRLVGSYVFLDVPRLGMSLQWDRGMRVYVKVDSMWQGRLKGLCGNYNGDSRDDYQTPGGGVESSALIFVDSWKLKQTCPKPQQLADHCQVRPERKNYATSICGTLKRHPFTLCHTEVPPTGFIERCEKDECACDSGDDCACTCTALAAYAHLCASRGVVFKWRTNELCPMQCDEECSNYDPCLSSCPLETCDNVVDYPEIKAICDQDTCVEGCKPKKSCPEGTVYTNNTFLECVPRAKCRRVCMTLPDGKEVLEGEITEEDACHTCRCSKNHNVCVGQPCSTLPTPAPLISTPGPTDNPHNDESFKCVSGWTPWLNRGRPQTGPNGESVDKEPLPKPNELQTGSPMCLPAMMTEIECRTAVNHKSAKETGLNAECSLERGLVCSERGNVCPDFEIRVHCQCEEAKQELPVETPPDVFQCLNSVHPNHPHPTDCTKFYECTPDATNPTKKHAVLKSCGEGLMYNPNLMICDWPASVIAVRPECGSTTVPTEATETTIQTTRPTTESVQTTQRCPPGLVYSDCAFPCDKMCHHFKKTMLAMGKCKLEKCVEGCVAALCEPGWLWRDEHSCVPAKDCTCYSDGNIVKPNGVVVDECIKCQCLENDLHCDSTDCSSSVEPSTLPSTTVPPTTVPPTTAALIVKNTATPPPQCAPDGYKNLLWGAEHLPSSAFTASSVAGTLYEPQYAQLGARPNDTNAGSWSPAVEDQQQYIQVTLPRREPVYGVILEGSPLFDQYVTSYQVLYGDDGHTFSLVEDKDGKPKQYIQVTLPRREPVYGFILEGSPLFDQYVTSYQVMYGDEGHTFSLVEDKDGKPKQQQYIQVTLPRREPVYGVILEGSPLFDQYVTSYQVLYGDDGHTFSLVEDKDGKPKYSQVTLPRREPVYGVILEGSPLFDQYVTSYQVLYGDDGHTFSLVEDKDGKPKYVTSYQVWYGDDGHTFSLVEDKDGKPKQQYIQVTLPRREPIYGVILEGSPLFDQYVTSYQVLYGDDGHTFSLVEDKDGKPKSSQVTLPKREWIHGILLESSSLFNQREPVYGVILEGSPLFDQYVTSYHVMYGDDGHTFSLVEDKDGKPKYIQVTLPRREPVYGVILEGSPLFDQYVTSYQVLYGDDGHTFSLVEDKDRKPKVFRGPMEHNIPMKQMIEPPIEAKVIRIQPLTWHDAISVRFDIIGCGEDSTTTYTPFVTTMIEPLIEAKVIRIQPLTWHDAISVRFDIIGCGEPSTTTYTPSVTTPLTWHDAISVRFDIIGCGQPSTTTYTPLVTTVSSIATTVSNILTMRQMIKPPIEAKVIRIQPLTWHDAISVRFDIIGCREPSTTTYIPFVTTPLTWHDAISVRFDIIGCGEPSTTTYIPYDITPLTWHDAISVRFDIIGCGEPSTTTYIPSATTPLTWHDAISVRFDIIGCGEPSTTTYIPPVTTPPIEAKVIRIQPLTWHDAISVRFDIIGCGEPSTTTYIPFVTTPPIEAKVIRIQPLTWHDAISVRFDIIGCREPSTTTYIPSVTTAQEAEDGRHLVGVTPYKRPHTPPYKRPYTWLRTVKFGGSW
ncbi:f5/8 type C domain-containing protein [Phthorimaea operculella]|nr:f5/8 type C domain-containing protein [Phthorimaea operculella]